MLPRDAVERGLNHLTSRPLHGLATESHLVLLGAVEELPWLRGAEYFGHSPVSKELYVPTALAPSAPEDLLLRALTRRVESESERLRVPSAVRRGPWLLRPRETGVDIVSLAEIGSVDAARLRAWAGGVA